MSMVTWKDGLPPTSRYEVGSGPKPVYATHYETREQTIGVRRGEHPQCGFCQHITERTFSVTEDTHNITLHKGEARAFACVACWSRLSLQNPGQYEDEESGR